MSKYDAIVDSKNSTITKIISSIKRAYILLENTKDTIITNIKISNELKKEKTKALNLVLKGAIIR
ncbi:MAG: hypothetical protein H6604_02355 [Flavobacteriales bacterium]|nr:hypothetical protein [Flavobacteriales bacterium]